VEEEIRVMSGKITKRFAAHAELEDDEICEPCTKYSRHGERAGV
jgi:hypothetical protein